MVEKDVAEGKRRRTCRRERDREEQPGGLSQILILVYAGTETVAIASD